MDTKELQAQLETLKTGLIEAATKEAKAEIEKQIKSVKEQIEAFDELKSDVKVIKDASEKNQKALDELIATKNKKESKTALPSFGEAFNEQLKEQHSEIVKCVGMGGRYKMQLKAVGNMTIANNVISGDTQVNYNSRQAILPSTKVNFRDLIPTNPSSTLVQVHYRESAGEGALAAQTEGSAKGQIDFDFSEIKTVNKYVAGFARFSKQLVTALPWMQATLPRLLLREFYAKENALFFATVNAAATGDTTTAETDDVKQLIDYIANQRVAKYNASVALVNHAQLARLNKLTYTNGYYSGSGGVLTNVDGSMAISGVPIVPVDWVTDDKVLIFDMDYLERVEAAGVTVEFFEQDSDNVQKNLITARIECLEEINPMMPASIIYADLGNVA